MWIYLQFIIKMKFMKQMAFIHDQVYLAYAIDRSHVITKPIGAIGIGNRMHSSIAIDHRSIFCPSNLYLHLITSCVGSI